MSVEPKSRFEWADEQMRALGAIPDESDAALEAHDRAPGGCDGSCLAKPGDPVPIINWPKLWEAFRRMKVMN